MIYRATSFAISAVVAGIALPIMGICFLSSYIREAWIRQIIKHDYGGDASAYAKDVWRENGTITEMFPDLYKDGN